MNINSYFAHGIDIRHAFAVSLSFDNVQLHIVNDSEVDRGKGRRNTHRNKLKKDENQQIATNLFQHPMLNRNNRMMITLLRLAKSHLLLYYCAVGCTNLSSVWVYHHRRTYPPISNAFKLFISNRSLFSPEMKTIAALKCTVIQYSPELRATQHFYAVRLCLLHLCRSVIFHIQ